MQVLDSQQNSVASDNYHYRSTGLNRILCRFTNTSLYVKLGMKMHVQQGFENCHKNLHYVTNVWYKNMLYCSTSSHSPHGLTFGVLKVSSTISQGISFVIRERWFLTYTNDQYQPTIFSSPKPKASPDFKYFEVFSYNFQADNL